ncbi:hypothetical protein KM043_013067 [Ampulex compressa]|nr:hypothetical protein KM043_013067 [Ampulex compressa]
MTLFLVVECSIAMCPLLREELAVRDVVTVVFVLLFPPPVPKQCRGFFVHHPETQEIACMFLPSNECCVIYWHFCNCGLISAAILSSGKPLTPSGKI